VTFSTKITIPTDAKPGKKILRNQIHIQKLRQAMHPPAWITVPDVELTIIGDQL